jgi:hypothetical protein
MQQARRIAEMPIGHWLEIDACGSCGPLRYASSVADADWKDLKPFMGLVNVLVKR